MIYREIAESELEALRVRVGADMSEKRYAHTLAVEVMAGKLAELYCPEKKSKIRAAALLHDVTKEYSTERHIRICREYGQVLTDEDLASPKTLHARTAAILIPMMYSEYSDIEIINAVRYHTTGCADMTLAEKIIFIADYIDDTRLHDDCVKLRDMFWGAEPERMDGESRLEHLDRVMLEALDMSISSLVAEGKIVNCDTVAARNSLIIKKKNRTKIQIRKE